jgi:biopolymer transport protein TolR
MKVERRQRRRPMAEINVVPYIDVMLVLLVIFMITAPLLSQGVEVNLPQAQASSIDDQTQQPIVVSIDSQGRYYLNTASNPQQPLSAQQLTEQVSLELQQASQQNKQRPVMVKGDKQVDYGKVVTAMVLLQQAGATQVGLVTEPTPK